GGSGGVIRGGDGRADPVGQDRGFVVNVGSRVQGYPTGSPYRLSIRSDALHPDLLRSRCQVVPRDEGTTRATGDDGQGLLAGSRTNSHAIRGPERRPVDANPLDVDIRLPGAVVVPDDDRAAGAVRAQLR